MSTDYTTANIGVARNGAGQGNGHAASPALQPQTFEIFMAEEFPAKEALIDGVLYRRDLIALVGRRRHGKTTLMSNLVLALSLPRQDFLGYQIPHECRVMIFYLEDDPGELQGRLQKMAQGQETSGRLSLHTKENFLQAGIPMDVTNSHFQEAVKGACRKARPDFIVFDNLAHLISAKYNDAEKIHKMIVFLYGLALEHNAAVLVAAHPRKRGKDILTPISLKDDPEAFFEECMGSSHLINSTGSLWGVERDQGSDRTCLLLGTQRLTGTQALTLVEKGEDDWFFPVSDYQENLTAACNTPKREQAWKLLPDSGPFKWLDGYEAVKTVMTSKSTFQAWWKELVRLGLVLSVSGDNTYVKVKPETYARNGKEG